MTPTHNFIFSRREKPFDHIRRQLEGNGLGRIVAP
jgi:hypothetical protein